MLRISTISVCPQAQANSPNLFSSSYCRMLKERVKNEGTERVRE
jgi:hypothetical protein